MSSIHYGVCMYIYIYTEGCVYICIHICVPTHLEDPCPLSLQMFADAEYGRYAVRLAPQSQCSEAEACTNVDSLGRALGRFHISLHEHTGQLWLTCRVAMDSELSQQSCTAATSFGPCRSCRSQTVLMPRDAVQDFINMNRSGWVCLWLSVCACVFVGRWGPTPPLFMDGH